MSTRGESTKRSAEGTKCPDPTLLNALVRGELADDLLEQMGRHVDTCLECQVQLEQLTVVDNLLQGARAVGKPQLVAEPIEPEPRQHLLSDAGHPRRSTRLWLATVGATLLVVAAAAAVAAYLDRPSPESQLADDLAPPPAAPEVSSPTPPASVTALDSPARLQFAEQLALAAKALEQGDVLIAAKLLADTSPELRGWEWKRLSGLCDLTDATLIAGGPICSIDYHPGGRLLAAALNDGRLQIWDVSIPRRQREWQAHEAGLTSAAWRPDGELLATASKDGTIQLWDAASAQVARTIQTNGASPFEIAWSADGQRLLSFARVEGGDTRLVEKWDADSGDRMSASNPSEASVLLTALSPNGRWRLTAGRDETNPETAVPRALRVRETVESHPTTTEAITWSSNARHIAMSGSQPRVCLSPLELPLRRASFGCDGTATIAMAFSPDGRMLAKLGRDRPAQLLEIWTDETFSLIADRNASLTDVKWAPDGQSLATADAEGQIKTWSLDAIRPCELLSQLDGAPTSFSWHPRGELVAVGTTSGDFGVWSVLQRRFVFRPQTRSLDDNVTPISQVAWSPNGKRLAIALQNGSVTVWDDQQGLSFSAGNSTPLHSLAWSSDGQLLATCNDEGTRLWNAADGVLARELPIEGPAFLAIAFGPEGRQIAGLDAEHQVRLFETSSRRLTKDLSQLATTRKLTSTDPSSPTKLRTSPGQLIAWNYRLNLLAWVGASGELVTWNAAGDDPPRVLSAVHDPLRVVAWHPDGLRLVTGDERGAIRIWDSVTGAELLSLNVDKYRRPVLDVAWSPQGSGLAAVLEDRGVRIYFAGRPPEQTDRAPTLELHAPSARN